MAQDVVGAQGLLDPPRPELGQSLHVGNRLLDLPDLVGVHHQGAVLADLLADDPGAAHVILEVAADLLLEMRPATGNAFAAEAAQLLVGVAEPAG